MNKRQTYISFGILTIWGVLGFFYILFTYTLKLEPIPRALNLLSLLGMMIGYFIFGNMVCNNIKNTNKISNANEGKTNG